MEYYSLNQYMKDKFGCKVYKISLNAGLTCPNRDGTISTGGCIFCSAGGSGEFAEPISSQESIYYGNIIGNSIIENNANDIITTKDNTTDNTITENNTTDNTITEDKTTDNTIIENNTTDNTITEDKATDNTITKDNTASKIRQQILKAKQRVAHKNKSGKYIAYFQAYTNTYGPVEYLEKIFAESMKDDDIVAISIATRPDCLGGEILKMLERLNQIKPVWVELGLQTIHESTAEYIRRGYPLNVFDEAVANLREIGIEVIVHVILGLPYETEEMILETVKYVSIQDIQGIKLQLLHVLKGTDLEKDYVKGKFDVLTLEQYSELVVKCISILPKNIVVHRITGDGDKKLLVAPMWSADKKKVLNTITKAIREY